MIHRRYQPVVFAFFMALLMSGIMSAVVTFFNVGAVPDFLSRWLHAWGMAFLVAFPIVLFIAPVVQKLVKWVIHD
jgi:hypothetical protein